MLGITGITLSNPYHLQVTATFKDRFGSKPYSVLLSNGKMGESSNRLKGGKIQSSEKQLPPHITLPHTLSLQ